MLKIPDHPGKLLRTARKRLRLTQSEAARRLDMDRRHLALFEADLRPPPPARRERMAAELELSLQELEAACGVLAPFDARRCRWGAVRYLPPRERDTRDRLLVARRRWPRVVESLERKIVRRQDYARVELFLRDVALESALELVGTMGLLADGADVGFASPQHAGYVEKPITDRESGHLLGHLLWPALYLRQSRIFLFQQPYISPCRLDFLAGHKERWCNIEVDGRGHDSSGDRRRPSLVAMSVARFVTEQVLEASFARNVEKTACRLLGI